MGNVKNFTCTLKKKTSLAKVTRTLESKREVHTLSGTPSAIMAIDLICGYSINSIVEE
jgi:hypothetical protein